MYAESNLTLLQSTCLVYHNVVAEGHRIHHTYYKAAVAISESDTLSSHSTSLTVLQVRRHDDMGANNILKMVLLIVVYVS